ncbi:unnamed protein product [Macrosiphum euphorbiae]|uniref:Uncharacterized protein n=1 Tax=Macrosiphum euphorbiae TaxID=13131 RepID=A0AAV0WJ44_9HEMI|nr:unnamed protein product [Macrosiphum euphorbiae]
MSHKYNKNNNSSGNSRSQISKSHNRPQRPVENLDKYNTLLEKVEEVLNIDRIVAKVNSTTILDTFPIESFGKYSFDDLEKPDIVEKLSSIIVEATREKVSGYTEGIKIKRRKDSVSSTGTGGLYLPEQKVIPKTMSLVTQSKMAVDESNDDKNLTLDGINEEIDQVNQSIKEKEKDEMDNRDEGFQKGDGYDMSNSNKGHDSLHALILKRVQELHPTLLDLGSQAFATGITSENKVAWDKFNEISHGIFDRSSNFFNYYIIYVLGYALPEKYKSRIEKSYAATLNIPSDGTIQALIDDDSLLKNQDIKVASEDTRVNGQSDLNTKEIEDVSEIVPQTSEMGSSASQSTFGASVSVQPTDDELKKLLKGEFLSTSPLDEHLVERSVDIPAETDETEFTAKGGKIEKQEDIVQEQEQSAGLKILCHSPQLSSIINQENTSADATNGLDELNNQSSLLNITSGNNGEIQQSQPVGNGVSDNEQGDDLIDKLLTDVEDIKKGRENTTKWVSAMSDTVKKELQKLRNDNEALKDRFRFLEEIVGTETQRHTEEAQRNRATLNEMSDAIKDLTSQMAHLRVTLPNSQTTNIVVDSLVYTNSNRTVPKPPISADIPQTVPPQSITTPASQPPSAGASDNMAALRKKLIERNRQRSLQSGSSYIKPPTSLERPDERPMSSGSQKAEIMMSSAQVAEALRQQRVYKVNTLMARKDTKSVSIQLDYAAPSTSGTIVEQEGEVNTNARDKNLMSVSSMGSNLVDISKRMLLKKSELAALSQIAKKWNLTVCDDMYKHLSTSSTMIQVTDEMKKARDALSQIADDATKVSQTASAIGLFEKHMDSIGLSNNSRDELFSMLRGHASDLSVLAKFLGFYEVFIKTLIKSEADRA